MTSLTTADTTSIIKTDEMGRRRTTAVRREELLDEFERSGLSGAKFAALTGLKYSTFAAWVMRRRKQAGTAVKAPAKLADPVRWLEALVEPNGSAGDPPVVVQLPGGARLELTHSHQAALVATLLRALEKPSRVASVVAAGALASGTARQYFAQPIKPDQAESGLIKANKTFESAVSHQPLGRSQRRRYRLLAKIAG